MKVPLLDLSRLPQDQQGRLRGAFDRVLASSFFINGPEVEAFERECAAYLETPQTVAVSSGTDALLLALLALEIGPGDEVICPSYTFFATAGSIWRTGATPVFVESAPCCYNLDPVAVAASISPRTKAILPVHLYGQAAELQPLLALAEKHGLALIEDAAQAFGARYHGQRVGTLGTLGCYSFFPSKNLGALGDAGLVSTSDAALADKLRKLRNHGSAIKYHHDLVGGNFRMDALQAAFLREKLPLLDAAHAARCRNAAHYRARLMASDKVALAVELCVCHLSATTCAAAPLLLPYACQADHIYNQFVIRAPGRREALRAYLTAQEIGTEIYYPVPLHQQECFSALPHRSLPWAETFAKDSLALPIFPELSANEIDYVCDHLLAFFA
jgi:dTDP-4-amino-4,6-dideoxygalactose transaminase